MANYREIGGEAKDQSGLSQKGEYTTTCVTRFYKYSSLSLRSLSRLTLSIIRVIPPSTYRGLHMVLITLSWTYVVLLFRFVIGSI